MALPPSLKPLQHVLSVSKQYVKRDPIVAYYCHLYAVQQGITLGKGDDTAKAALFKLMDELETMKRHLKDDEAIKEEVVGQSHVEQAALKIFELADAADKRAEFNQKLVKLFFVSSQLFTVLDQFGEQTDEIEYKRKYAKWKAVDIDRCLKNGITPTPGPAGGFAEEEGGGGGEEDEGRLGEPIQMPPTYGFNVKPTPGVIPPYPGAQPVLPGQPGPTPVPLPRTNIPPPSRPDPAPPTIRPDPTPPTFRPNPAPPVITQSVPPPSTAPIPSGGMAKLSGVQKDQVQKYCKYAISALDFNDSPGAIKFLEKSLRMLRTGKED